MRQDKQIRVFVRQTFNGFTTLLITILGQSKISTEFVYLLPLIYAALNAFTKRVNVVVFKDLGVDTKEG
jgi:hypothetical protein